MMNYLLTVSAQIGEGLRDFLDSLMPNRIRGAMIGVDDYWIEAVISTLWSPSLPLSREALLLWKAKGGWQFPIEYRPPDWNVHCRVMGYPEDATPVYVRVIVRDPDDIRKYPLPREYSGYPLIFEYRPTCVALSNVSEFISRTLRLFDSRPNVSIGRAQPNTAGTLGGLLQCPATGLLYAVSCAHVLGSEGTDIFCPGPYEGRDTTKIGQVRLSQLPSSTPPGTSCHPKIMTQAKRLDVSVAEITNNDPVSVSVVSTVNHMRRIVEMQINDYVSFYGKESGWKEAQIKHLCIWYEIDVNTKPHCFGDIFELEQPRPRYLNLNLCKPGDSGAWVVSKADELYSWDGMLFAGDGANVYCCFAEYIMDTCRVAFPGGLALVL